MSKFQLAGPAEILRSTQKDQYYLQYSKNLIGEVVQKALGVYHWLKWRHRYEMFADFIYFYLTSVSGYQTLGEEYVHIVQVDGSLRRLPSKLRRISDMLLFTFGTYVLGFALKYVEKLVQEKRYPLQPPASMPDNVHEQLEEILPLISKGVTYFHRLHLVLFYFFGAFYHISKRIAGVRYVTIRRWLRDSALQKSYRVLAWITASQLAISFGLDLYNFFMRKSSGTEKSIIPSGRGMDDGNISNKDKCSLCLERRKHSTLTPCGHLFCWSCITEWMQNKEECPLCREEFCPSRLIYLQNYA